MTGSALTLFGCGSSIWLFIIQSVTLKQKTISGLIWSFIDSIAGQGITFIVGIILARMLSPKEFGLIGMLAIFILSHNHLLIVVSGRRLYENKIVHKLIILPFSISILLLASLFTCYYFSAQHQLVTFIMNPF